MFKFTVRHQGDVAIVAITGKLTLGSGDEQLLDIVNDLLAAGGRKILLDCGQLAFIDSVGIGVLVAAFTKARNRQGTLALSSLTARLREQMEITRLITVFNIYDSEADALRAMTA